MPGVRKTNPGPTAKRGMRAQCRDKTMRVSIARCLPPSMPSTIVGPIVTRPPGVRSTVER